VSYEYQPGEREALEELSESAEPMARVIYHMSMRQLAMSERLIAIENEMIAAAGRERRLLYALEKIVGGSNPGLRAVVMGEGS